MKKAWGLLLLFPVLLAATKKQAGPEVFYVYNDKGSQLNHFIPSGWMGDYGDMKLEEGSTEDPIDGRSSIKITYNAKATQGANWAGIYWQTPANNWGEKAGGYDLSQYTKLTFWAKAKTKAQIAEFKVGGITGTFMDSDSQSIGPITLGDRWKQYTISLKDKDMTKIIGGFCWSASRDDNPQGFELYLDEIRYEK